MNVLELRNILKNFPDDADIILSIVSEYESQGDLNLVTIETSYVNLNDEASRVILTATQNKELIKRNDLL